MKYRWGFLDENDIFTECQPIVDDSTAIDFSQESNEIFYRGKLNGSIAFRFDFDDIMAKGYNYEHRIVLQWYDADNDLWKEVWKGRFALTDCEIDFDTNTITVQPSTIDRYTKVLDHIEDEYNLVRLGAQQKPVNILIRPVVQLYALNDSKISNFVGGNSWEASCDTVGAADIDNFNFLMVGELFAFNVKFSPTFVSAFAGQTVLFSGTPDYSGTPRVFDVSGIYAYWNGFYTEYRTLTLRVQIVMYSDETRFSLFWPDGLGWESTPFVSATFGGIEAGTDADIYIRDEGTPSAYCTDANAQWTKMYSRTICQTELTDVTIDGTTYPLYDLPATDMAGANLNFNKVLKAQLTKNNLSGKVQIEPTEWGLSYNEQYFVKPADTATYHYYPVGQSQWKYISWWVSPEVSNGVQLISIADSLLKAKRRIKDGVLLEQAILKLLQKAGWSGTFQSGILGGTENYAGYVFLPVLTAKSNVISSYYDTPAQNAPISLLKIFSMLKQAYKIYWHIDNSNKIHFENVAYYDNGFSYSEDAPDVLIDLEGEIHTNTKKNKVFGQNKIKFDKQDMPAQYTFAWMDKLTRPFDGFPINCLDAYVQKGLTDEMQVGDFSTDVDCILSSPNDVSKEGFVLFALPYKDGAFQDTLQIEKLRITNEAGETYNVTIQNAEAAFAKIHENMWRFSLPCEHVNINNENTIAKTTGRFKLQNVEFADTVMAEILKDIDNCNKVIRTQQGDGHIKTLSINLNSLVAKGDLLFNFVGRWYYLKGTALGASITIFVNGESTIIEVSNNKFTYRYKEPISTLTFGAADVVFVDFADCDNLDNLTSCDSMFDGCEELLAVDFGGKTFGAVTSANNMFRGCVALTTLICPDSSTWKADLDFSDCPALTLESFYDLIKFLYYYNSGVHTITPNSTMWNALDATVQNDLIAKATAKGWTINIPAQYSVTGESTSSTVYATINGSAVEIPVTGGVWQYDYNAAITSISFENDSNLTKVDFSLSDGLAGLTTLADAFKNCSALTSVDFSNCDLSNVASATDTFAGCTSLTELIVPAGTWKPDVDLSDTAMVYADMLSTIGMLYTYSTGVHTITFNSTTWGSFTQAQQQTISDAADAKGWTTNAVVVVYVVRGTSTNIGGTETFNVVYINDGSSVPESNVTERCFVDAQGNWSFSFTGKKIYGLAAFASNNTRITSVDFTDAALALVRMSNVNAQGAFMGCSNLQSVSFPIAETFENVETCRNLFNGCTSLTAIDMPNATFENCTDCYQMFADCSALTTFNLPNATFASATECYGMFLRAGTVQMNFSLPSATFANVINALGFMTDLKAASVAMPVATFANCTDMTNIFLRCTATSISMPNATFASATNQSNVRGIFYGCTALQTINWQSATLQSILYTTNIFYTCNALQNISVPTNATAIAPTATPSNTPIDARYSPLTYQSMFNLASWVCDFSGQSAHTMTFKTSAWNALSSAEQNTIDGILSGKNWNRAIA